MGSDSSITGVAIGVSLSLVIILLLGAAGFMYMRRERSNEGFSDLEDQGRRSIVLERSHPASRVTPFGGAGDDTPRFNRKPGEAMRFAQRRSDGGWDFSAPLAISPAGLSPLGGTFSALPSPTTSVMTASSFGRKETLPGESTKRGYLDMDIYGVPPPAYTPRMPPPVQHAQHRA